MEAYEKLVSARRYPGESFSEVILRAYWPEDTVTGSELLKKYRESGPHFSEAALDAVDELKRDDAPPKDKWTED